MPGTLSTSQAAIVVAAALHARTAEDAQKLEALIGQCVGGKYQRPLFDVWGHFGIVSPTGSFDHILLENVTNMQDAVVDLEALLLYKTDQHVPFKTPREAATQLLKGKSEKEIAEMVSVEFFDSGEPRSITATFRDRGCGMLPEQVPTSIFGLGSSRKERLFWQQGAFGLGAKHTYRNAKAVVLVTRRDPRLLAAGQDDRICVAVLRWEAGTKGNDLYYLVSERWNPELRQGLPFSAPAHEFPDFEPGTYVALITYGTEGFHRNRLGDERSFDTVLNTRLFKPITRVRFSNSAIQGRDRHEFLGGLALRLENRGDETPSGSQDLPFNIGGKTFLLPVTYYLFAAQGEPGERRKFVAKDHCVIFTSNGQVHKHWTPSEWRYKTKLKKLADRVLIVVET
ncbi:MAG: hypothetical protein QOJ65_2045, partial [Fimbriimonadaceae bacterium]|nr:hypothetical protein [Fimbriimonadaceae bacterium]